MYIKIAKTLRCSQEKVMHVTSLVKPSRLYLCLDLNKYFKNKDQVKNDLVNDIGIQTKFNKFMNVHDCIQVPKCLINSLNKIQNELKWTSQSF